MQILLGPFKDTEGQWESSLEGCDFRGLLPFLPRLSLAKSTRDIWGLASSWHPFPTDFQPSFSSPLPSPSYLPSGFSSLGSQGPDAEQILFGEILECVC